MTPRPASRLAGQRGGDRPESRGSQVPGGEEGPEEFGVDYFTIRTSIDTALASPLSMRCSTKTQAAESEGQYNFHLVPPYSK
jgi:hypothetical protein